MKESIPHSAPYGVGEGNEPHQSFRFSKQQSDCAQHQVKVPAASKIAQLIGKNCIPA